MEIQYDSQGRMNYHPSFHHNHYKRFTESDLEYLCKYWEYDDRRTMAYALGRPEKSLSTIVGTLKRTGKFEYYKNLNKHW